MDALEGADALMIMTPWPEFKLINPMEILEKMKGNLILDPYSILPLNVTSNVDIDIYTLGRSPTNLSSSSS
jgi:UDPglucose 6-dehydrogenase